MNSLNKLLIMTVCLICPFLFCGGGADIGNPGVIMNSSYVKIKGIVKQPNGEAASKARVVLCHYSGEPYNGEQIDTVEKNGISIITISHTFDTVECTNDGTFEFEDKRPGTYVLVAEKKPRNGIVKIVAVDDAVNAVIKIDAPISMDIKPYSTFDTTHPYFSSARIAGSYFTAKINQSGTFRFDSVPSGPFDIVLFRNDKVSEMYSGLSNTPGKTIEMDVDPARSSAYWTVKSDSRKWDDCPYVLRYGVSGDSMQIVSSSIYNFYIQFSHPMDTYLSSKALKLNTSDSTMQIDSLWWQGGDLMLVRLGRRGGPGNNDQTVVKTSNSVSITVDTTAVSKAGVKVAWPENLKVW